MRAQSGLGVSVCLVLALWLPFGLFGTRARQSTAEGALRYQASDFDGARAAFDHALHDYPDAPEPAYNVAAALYKGEAFEDAEKAFAEVARSAHSRDLVELEERARFAQGNALFRQGKYREAIAAYDQALALQPDDAEARENRALAEEMLKRPPEQPRQEPQEGQPQPEGEQTPGPYPGAPLSEGESQANEQEPESSDSGQSAEGAESTAESTGRQPSDGGQSGEQRGESEGTDSPSGAIIDQHIPTPPPSANYRPMPEEQADMLLHGQRNSERMGRAGRLSQPGDPFSSMDELMSEMEQQLLGDLGTRRPHRRPSRPPW